MNLTLTLTLGKKNGPEGLNVNMNYEFNLLDYVGVVAKASKYGGRCLAGGAGNTPTQG